MTLIKQSWLFSVRTPPQNMADKKSPDTTLKAPYEKSALLHNGKRSAMVSTSLRVFRCGVRSEGLLRRVTS